MLQADEWKMTESWSENDQILASFEFDVMCYIFSIGDLHFARLDKEVRFWFI